MAKLTAKTRTAPPAKATAPQPPEKGKLSPAAAARIRAKANRILGAA